MEKRVEGQQVPEQQLVEHVAGGGASGAVQPSAEAASGEMSSKATGGAADAKTSALGPTYFTEVTLADGQSPVTKTTCSAKRRRPSSTTTPMPKPKAKVPNKDRPPTPEYMTNDGSMMTDVDYLSDDAFESDGGE